jgi:hypothetical protein
MVDGRFPVPSNPVKSDFLVELKDAVTPRAAGLMLAVLIVQLAFIGSYIGAFHAPTPQRIPIAVVYPGPADKVLAGLNGLKGKPVRAHQVPDEATARRQIEGRQVYGALIMTGTAAYDRLLIAGAAGSSVAQALTQVITQVEQAQKHDLVTVDVKPALLGDARGLSGFYLALGWVIGGYLVAIAVSTSKGARPANRHRAVIRLTALAVYAGVSGVLGTVLAQRFFGPLSLDLIWFGALLVFASGAFTMALQALFGFVGMGLAVVLFVVLGNPSAGGPYPAPLLPPFWRAIGPWLPPGAGTDAIRGIAYFHGAGVQPAAMVLGGYAILGVLGTLVASAMQEPRPVLMADLHKAKKSPVRV